MNRSRMSLFTAALLAALTLAWPLRAASDADTAAARALVKRYADAVVGIELVVTMKVKVGDREQPPQEQRIEVNGTVISSSGLTVTSLAEVDPQAVFDALRAGGARTRAELVGIEFKEVKLRLADGREIPARFVLKDGDLDLAFMAPDVTSDGVKPEFPSYVKLEESTEGALLDDYYNVGRAPKVLQRVPVIQSSAVAGIVEKPRRFYLMTSYSLGTPVFNPKGQVLGITLQNFASGRRTGLVVLPAADIAEIAKQAASMQAMPAPAPVVPTVDVAPAPAATP